MSIPQAQLEYAGSRPPVLAEHSNSLQLTQRDVFTLSVILDTVMMTTGVAGAPAPDGRVLVGADAVVETFRTAPRRREAFLESRGEQ